MPARKKSSAAQFDPKGSPFSREILDRSARAIKDSQSCRAEARALLKRRRALVYNFSRLRIDLMGQCDRAHHLVRMTSDLCVYNAAQEASEPITVGARPAGDYNALFTDLEILDDHDLISALNERSFECDHCGGDEPLVAVVRIPEKQTALGICGKCFGSLSALSRGQVN